MTLMCKYLHEKKQVNTHVKIAQYLISATLGPSIETMKRKYIFRYLEVVVFIANEDF